MDMQTADHAPVPPSIDPDGPLSRIFTKTLLQSLAATMPGVTRDDTEAWAEKWDATRELFDSLAPSDPADAQLAAIAVALSQSAMDSLARANRPGISDEAAGRLRSGGLAAGRAYFATLRYLRRRQAEAAEARPAPAPSPPVPRAEPTRAAPQPPPAFIASQPNATPNPRRDPAPRAQLPAAPAYPRPSAPEAKVLPAPDTVRTDQAALGGRQPGQLVGVDARGGSG